MQYPTSFSIGPSTPAYLIARSPHQQLLSQPRILAFSSIMGRPKVHPANRLRANTACTTCRASKKRCSGTFPCSNCIHKGRGRSCIPFKSTSVAGLRSRPSPASRAATEDIPTWGSPSVNLQSPLVTQVHDSSSVDRQIERPEVGSRSPEATHRTHPRMLRNLQGEKGMGLLQKLGQGLSDFAMQSTLAKPLLSPFCSSSGRQ